MISRDLGLLRSFSVDVNGFAVESALLLGEAACSGIFSVTLMYFWVELNMEAFS